MTPESIKAAEDEARRFLARVKEWRAAQSTYTATHSTYSANTPKQSGALRRASMDLTCALAEMRKP